MGKDIELHQTQPFDHVEQVFGQPLHPVAMIGLIGFSMTTMIERNHAGDRAKIIELARENGGCLRPARNHHDGAALPALEIAQAHAVAGLNKLAFHRPLPLAPSAGRYSAMPALFRRELSGTRFSP